MDSDNVLTMEEFLEQVQRDEIEDAPLQTPVNYAKIRPVSPQLVYYAIRTKKLNTYLCDCGRRCIKTEEADDYFRGRRGEVAWPWGAIRAGSEQEVSPAIGDGGAEDDE